MSSNLKRSKRNALNEFASAIHKIIEPIYHSRELNTEWTDIWEIWRLNGINAKTSMTRKKLSLLIQGEDKQDERKPRREIYDIIKSMTTQIPLITTLLDIQFSESDRDIFTYQLKSNLTDKPDTTDTIEDHSLIIEDTTIADSTFDNKQVSTDWTKVPGTFTPDSKSESVAKIPTQINDTVNRNQYATLEQEGIALESSITSGISYDSSQSGLKLASQIARKPTQKIFAKTSIYNAVLYPKLSDQTLKDIQSAIRNGTIDDINETLLAEWILNAAQNAVIETDKNNQILHKETENNLQRINTSVNENLQQLTTHTDKLKGEVTQNLASIRKQTIDARNDCNGVMINKKKEIDDAISSIGASEISAISSINSTANEYTDQLIKLNKESASLIHQLQASKTIGITSAKEITTLMNNLKERIQTGYEQHDETLMEQADDHKEKFRDWLETISNSTVQDNDILIKLKKEREEITKERQLMKAERTLMQQTKEEMQTLLHDFKSKNTDTENDNPPPIPIQPQIKIEDDSTHKPMFNNIKGILKETRPTPLIADTAIQYKDALHKITGFIKPDKPTFEDGHWHYNIYSYGGTEINHCSDKFITVYKDEILENDQHHNHHEDYKSDPTPPKSITSPYDDRRYGSTNPTKRSRPLGANEMEYPLGTDPKSIWTESLIKYGKHWDIKVNSIDDIRGFYDTMQNRLSEYHIYLIPYEDITLEHGLEAIMIDNCRNYEAAKMAMSKSIFIYLDTYKDTIFENFTNPKNFIEAYRHTYNGLGFLKHIMKQKHPKLRDISNRTTDAAPTFIQHTTIYSFINSYLHWINDEKIRGRHHSDKEKLDWVMHCLDEERWGTATRKIDRMLEDIYLDRKQPKPFPECLKLSPDLAIYLVELLPDDERHDLENIIDTSKINKTTYQNNRRVENPYNKQHKSTNRTRDNYKSAFKDKPTSHKWAKDLKWDIIPGAICPACKKSNHNIYKTGCPTMAQFCACQEFYDITPKDQLKPVMNAYQNYLREIQSKMKTRRNSDRKNLRLLKREYDNDDMAVLKKTFFTNYLDDFNEDQYVNHNPYDDITIIEDYSDDEVVTDDE